MARLQDEPLVAWISWCPGGGFGVLDAHGAW